VRLLARRLILCAWGRSAVRARLPAGAVAVVLVAVLLTVRAAYKAPDKSAQTAS